MCEDPRKAVERVTDQVSNATGIRTVDDVINVGTQYLTYGLVGYEDGKFGAGVTTRAADEGIGEVTGRNQARKANMDAKDAVAAEAAARRQDMADQKARKARLDVQTSVEAGLLTNSVSAQQRSQLLGQAEAGMTRDFLGL
jgi:hypothetical protein